MVQQAARRAGFDARERDRARPRTRTPGPPATRTSSSRTAPSRPRRRPSVRRQRARPACCTRSWCAGWRWRIARAHADLAPRGRPAWGSTRLAGVTAQPLDRGAPRRPRHRACVAARAGASEDPVGPAHTIDPNVDVLRVDRLRGGRRVPLGAWSTFANHGTVNRSTFPYYNGDHHAAAARVFEAAVRRAGRVAPRADVVNVYGNGDAGDVSAGPRPLRPGRGRGGRPPRGGRRCSRPGARPGRGLTAQRRALELALDARVLLRPAHPVRAGSPTTPSSALSYLTGSEEGRGPLFDATGDIYEGQPAGRAGGAAGRQDRRRAPTPTARSSPPRCRSPRRGSGDRLIVTVPGEMTVELGRRTRAAALRPRWPARARAAWWWPATPTSTSPTSPPPRSTSAQHYEGGTTVYGPASGPFLTSPLADLAGRLARGARGARALPVRSRRAGCGPTARPYPAGARARPDRRASRARPRRLGARRVRWRGGADGPDRPLDRAVRVRCSAAPRRGWRTVDDDLGLRILWRVDDDRPQELGHPVLRAGAARHLPRLRGSRRRQAPAGPLPLRGHAPRRYRLASRPFRSAPARCGSHGHARARRGARPLALRYPAAVPERDLTIRPAPGREGRPSPLLVGGRRRVLRARRGRARFYCAPGRRAVRVPAGGAPRPVRERERPGVPSALMRDRIHGPRMSGEELRAEAAARSRARARAAARVDPRQRPPDPPHRGGRVSSPGSRPRRSSITIAPSSLPSPPWSPWA